MKKISHRNDGFTLIELIVVISIVAVIAALVTGVLFSALRGSSKTNVLADVKENGNYVLSVIGRTLRFAKSFEGVSTDGTVFTTSCAAGTKYKAVKITSFDSGDIEFSCTETTITSNGTPLLNASLVVLNQSIPQSLDRCSFTCIQNGSDYPTIGVQFLLTDRNTSTLVENKAALFFQSSVTLRNAR